MTHCNATTLLFQDLGPREVVAGRTTWFAADGFGSYCTLRELSRRFDVTVLGS